MKNILTPVTTPILTLILHYLEKYIFKDWHFLGFLVVLILVDTGLALVKSWKSKTVSSQGFSKIFTKCLIYFGFLVMAHVLKFYEVQGATNSIFGWIDSAACALIMVRESLSIVENIAAIDDRIIPTWFIKRLKQFDQDGKFQSEEIIKTPATNE